MLFCARRTERSQWRMVLETVRFPPGSVQRLDLVHKGYENIAKKIYFRVTCLKGDPSVSIDEGETCTRGGKVAAYVVSGSTVHVCPDFFTYPARPWELGPRRFYNQADFIIHEVTYIAGVVFHGSASDPLSGDSVSQVEAWMDPLDEDQRPTFRDRIQAAVMWEIAYSRTFR